VRALSLPASGPTLSPPHLSTSKTRVAFAPRQARRRRGRRDRPGHAGDADLADACPGGAPGETVAIDRASLVRQIEEDLRQGLKT
jgi:hypothetical protein